MENSEEAYHLASQKSADLDLQRFQNKIRVQPDKSLMSRMLFDN